MKLIGINLILVLAMATSHRNVIWSSSALLWFDCTIHSPAKPRPYLNLGMALLEIDQLTAAKQEFERVLQITTDNPSTNVPIDYHSGALSNLAAIDLELGLYYSVIQRLESIRPMDRTAEIIINLSVAYLRSHQWSKAEELLSDGVYRHPSSGVMHWNLGDAYSALGECGLAVEQYDIAVNLDPDLRPKGCTSIPSRAIHG